MIVWQCSRTGREKAGGRYAVGSFLRLPAQTPVPSRLEKPATAWLTKGQRRRMGERPGGRHCPDDTRRASQTSGLEEPVGMAASMMPVISGEIRRGWTGETKVPIRNEAICGIIRLSAQGLLHGAFVL